MLPSIATKLKPPLGARSPDRQISIKHPPHLLPLMLLAIRLTLILLLVKGMLSFRAKSIIGRSISRNTSKFTTSSNPALLASTAAVPLPTVNLLPNLTITSQFGYETKADMLVVPFYTPDGDIATLKDALPSLPLQLKETISNVLNEGIFKAEASSKYLLRLIDPVAPYKHIALVGLGTPEKNMSPKMASKLGKIISQLAVEHQITSLALVSPSGLLGDEEHALQALVLGVYDALYVDNRFKKLPPTGHTLPKLQTLCLLGAPPSPPTTPAAVEAVGLSLSSLSRWQAIAAGVSLTKDLVGAPANSKTPPQIIAVAQQLADTFGMEMKVLGLAECQALGMGGYLGVQQGSGFPPQFLHLKYTPRVPKTPQSPSQSIQTLKKVALVGKGLTFDSGGYNLKTGAGSMIELMKFDMGGAGAILGTARAIGEIQPQVSTWHWCACVYGGKRPAATLVVCLLLCACRCASCCPCCACCPVPRSPLC